MNEWLISATKLVNLRRPEALASNFVTTLKSRLQLDDCMLLVPNHNGRVIAPYDRESSLSWSVMDFNSPIAHVLQSTKPMVITSDELVFWPSDRSFTALTEKLGMFGKVLLQPLPLGAKKIQAILVVTSDCSDLDKMFNDEALTRYVDVFSNQWSLINELAKEEQAKMGLCESISNFTRDSEKQDKCTQLSQSLLGRSSIMNSLREQIISAASSQISVMIQGETGTGKELVAKAVHDFSTRKNAPFIAINCAAIPESLLESELFGYSKGAFSGADQDKQGLIAQANGGTLFLDEIGDMPLALQAKLLRVLESKAFRPVGSKQEQVSDFRLVSATHINLVQLVKNKEFRQDLYYRLYQYPLTLPTLAQRVDDIELLSQHFVQHYNSLHNTQIRGLHYEALDHLKAHSFPGNVRELKHLIEFGCAQTPDNTQVEAHCFSHRISQCELSSPAHPATDSDSVEPKKPCFRDIDDLKEAMREYEFQIIQSRLSQYLGDRAKAAKSLGIPKRTLAYKCLKMEI